MGATATLSQAGLAVDPGSETTCEVLVRNTGTVVDQFTCEVIGDAAAWATADPPSLSLFPGAEGTVTVRFQPPKLHSIPPGPMPFGVKATSKEDPEGSVVEEGTIEVGRFAEGTAEILPRTSSGRRSGTHNIAFDNRGNDHVSATLFASDADQKLNFELKPATLEAEAGTATFARVVAKPRKRFLRGNPVTHPFQVVIEPDVGETIAVDATMVQQAILPRWFFKALLAALLVAAALLLAWFTLLRPTIKSLAEDIAAETVEDQVAAATAPLAAENAALQERVAAVEEAAAPAGDAGAEPSPAPDSAEALAAQLALQRDLGDPFDRRLGRSVAAGAERADAFVIPDGQVFSVTDIVLQNPQGDSGVLQIKRGNDTVLIEVRLENFRDLDYHFVSPLTFTGGQQLVLNIRCEVEAPAACNSAAHFSGFMRLPPEPEETPAPQP